MIKKIFLKISFIFIVSCSFLWCFSFAENSNDLFFDEGKELYNIGQKQAKNIPDNNFLKSETGVVKSVSILNNNENKIDDNVESIIQKVEIEILSGCDKGKTIFLENVIMGNPTYDINLSADDKVILHCEKDNNKINYYIEDIQRTDGIYILAGLFVLLILIVGKSKGLRSLLSIIVTLLFIFYGLIPLILNNFNPILSTILICICSCIISFYLIGGINIKSTSAILGTICSLSLAGILALITINICHLTGFCGEESLFLFMAYPILNFSNILVSAILIGALGALMDISMSISSTVNEIFIVSEDISFKNLFNSGMNVGKDIIGTMANTLILAYLGASLFLILLANQIDLQKFFNLNQVVTEISAAFVGSISIVVCVPITAFFATFLLLKKRELKNKNVENFVK